MRLGLIISLFAALSGCDLADCVSLTLERNTTTTIPGVGLDDRVAIEVGAIERTPGAERAGLAVAPILIHGPDGVLARRQYARRGERMRFTAGEADYILTIDGFEDHVLCGDMVEVTVRRQ